MGHSVNKGEKLGLSYFKEKQKCIENFNKESALNP